MNHPRVQNIHLAEMERVSLVKRRVVGIAAVAGLTGIGAWLTAPYGIVLLTRGEVIGWALLVLGVALAVGCALAVVAAVRAGRAVAPPSLPGRANARFDEPEPSQDVRPTTSWAGSLFGS